MSGLSVKVAIKQEWDGEEGEMVWKAEVKDWGLKAQDRMLEGALLVMQRKIITYLQDTFGSRRQITATMGTASARVEFDIEVQKDRTLDQFECEIIAGDGSARAPLEKVMATAQKLMDLQEETGVPAATILKRAKAKIESDKKDRGAGK